LVIRPPPSVFRTSNAYSISARLPPDIGQWPRGEHTEAAGEVPCDLCRVFIVLTRKRACRGLVAEPDTGRCHRGQRRSHTGAVHLIQRFRQRPFDQRVLARLAGTDLGNERRRSMMMMNIDPKWRSV